MGITKEQFRDAISQVKTFVLGKTSNMVPKTRTINGKALSEDITLKASDIGADASGTAANQITSHNISTSAHNDIRLLITGLTDRLNTLADSDDTTLDQMKEVVAYIKANRELIESITTSKINVADIIDNLETNVSDKPLSAAQGVTLKLLIDALQTAYDNHIADTSKHISDEERTNWNAAHEYKHGHGNWNILNSITQTLLDGWNSAVTHISDSIKHITSEERTAWNNKASCNFFSFYATDSPTPITIGDIYFECLDLGNVIILKMDGGFETVGTLNAVIEVAHDTINTTNLGNNSCYLTVFEKGTEPEQPIHHGWFQLTTTGIKILLYNTTDIDLGVSGTVLLQKQ